MVLLLTVAACGRPDAEIVPSQEVPGEPGSRLEPGEKQPDGSVPADREDGEESATQFGLDDTYDYSRNGARLVVSYDAATNEFQGHVKNTTEDTLRRVRVEIHLSNGVELGPTTPVDLVPGQTAAVSLPATQHPFSTWSAHPEVGGGGNGEHEAGAASGEHGEGASNGEQHGNSESIEHRGG